MTEKLSVRLDREARAWADWNAEHPDDQSPTTEALLREAAELARRVEDSQWIACADRLPDPSDHVQVFPDTHEPQTYNFYAHFNGGTNGVKAGNWYHNDETGYDHIITPTHWRRISRDEPSVRLVVEVGDV